MTFREALMDKESWRKYMAGPTRALEEFVYRAMPHHDKCYICSTGMNGVVNHILGQNHYKKLWGRLAQMPDAARALDWSQPWAEKFQVGERFYLFNHVTGQQGWQHELQNGGAPVPLPGQEARPPQAGPPQGLDPPAAKAAAG